MNAPEQFIYIKCRACRTRHKMTYDMAVELAACPKCGAGRSRLYQVDTTSVSLPSSASQARAAVQQEQQPYAQAATQAYAPVGAYEPGTQHQASKTPFVLSVVACALGFIALIVAIAGVVSDSSGQNAYAIAEVREALDANRKNAERLDAKVNEQRVELISRVFNSVDSAKNEFQERLDLQRDEIDENAMNLRSELRRLIGEGAEDIDNLRAVVDKHAENAELDSALAKLVDSYNSRIFLVLSRIPIYDPDGKLIDWLSGTGTGWLAKDDVLVTNKHVILGQLFEFGESLQGIEDVIPKGFTVQPKKVFVAAWPHGARANLRTVGDDIRFDLQDAWLRDGTSSGRRPKGKMEFVSLGEMKAGEFGDDLVALKLSRPIKDGALPMASDEELAGIKQLDEIMVIGYPWGFQAADGETITTSPSLGHVRAYDKRIHRITTDASVVPGNSGGPLINKKGLVIGVTTLSGTSAETMNMSIAVSKVRHLLSRQDESRAKRELATFTVTGRAEFPLIEDNTERESDRIQEFAVEHPLANWLEIKSGMTADRVKELLGEPSNIEYTSSTRNRWVYTLPYAGHVNMNKSKNTVYSRVTPWSKVSVGDNTQEVLKILQLPDKLRRLPAERVDRNAYYVSKGDKVRNPLTGIVKVASEGYLVQPIHAKFPNRSVWLFDWEEGKTAYIVFDEDKGKVFAMNFRPQN